MLLIANIFQPLITIFEAVLKFFHNSMSVPWGWSIVLLTIAVRLVLLPLTVKQFHSMQRLQQHMPELKAIQNKYKEDKQRQQQEVMKFYKENNVNPFGSCLPLVAQFPVLIALFYMLRESLRVDICPQVQPHHLVHGVSVINHAQTRPCGSHGGAGFLFISDLTSKATGATLIVLLLLYVGTQLGASLMMSSPTMDKMQRQLMLVMPLFFVIFFIQFPAGLLVYWITTNVWMIAQQMIVRRLLGPIAPPAAAVAGASGDGGRTAVGAESAANGAASSGGLAGLLNRIKPAEAPAAVSTTRRERTAPPPPPPRKKKKRSGRRR
jgi:YidC/Oxa1 family membrane protein insertase